jgi:hypothetical protein
MATQRSEAGNLGRPDTVDPADELMADEAGRREGESGDDPQLPGPTGLLCQWAVRVRI